MDRHPQLDLAILDFGVFVVASSSNGGFRHSIRVTYVPRMGPTMHETPFSWTTAACPEGLVQAVSYRAETFLEDAVIALYGLEGSES